MDLFLRKVDHPQATNNYRVIASLDGTEFEIGSIGAKFHTDVEPVWSWGRYRDPDAGDRVRGLRRGPQGLHAALQGRPGRSSAPTRRG
jgi:hypothetical protein